MVDRVKIGDVHSGSAELKPKGKCLDCEWQSSITSERGGERRQSKEHVAKNPSHVVEVVQQNVSRYYVPVTVQGKL